MKALCIGHIAYDITLEMDSFPQENTRNDVINTYECGGGSTANCACLLAKWQEPSYICGVIGYDSYSEKIKREFTDFKVNLDYLEIDYEHKTSLSYIILNPHNGSRTIMRKKLDLAPVKRTDFTIINADVILLDGYEHQTALKALKSMPTAISILDAGRNSKDVLDLCNKVKIIICSKEFAEQITGIHPDKKDMNKVAAMFLEMKKRYPAQEVVITLEDEGAVYSYENHIKILPALKVVVKDSTGAGDIFHGAFAYQYYKTKDVEKAVKFANVAAGLSAQNIGVKNSFPELEEVNRYYEQL